jgi:hypothetical protein
MIPITDSQTMARVRLERILKYAVVLSWDELMTEPASGLIHVEYQSGDDGSLDFLKVWASTSWGEWKLVCEFWVRPLWSHTTGLRFSNKYHSAELARTLELAIGKDAAFAGEANLHGMVQVPPPTTIERNEAERMIQTAPEDCACLPVEKHAAA